MAYIRLWWHPVDHISSDWLQGQPGTHIGSTCKVQERFTGTPAQQLLIQFREPAEFFSAAALSAARANQAVSGLVCGRAGASWRAPRNPAGQMLGSRMVHLCRDTAWVTVLRSHFFLGRDLPLSGKSADHIAQAIPDAAGAPLLAHCHNKFMFLSRFLPSLFIAENKASQPVQLPW